MKRVMALLVAAILTAAPGALQAGPATGPAAAAPTDRETLPALTYRPGRGDAIVVFAAHPDDETLGAGGFIHAASAAGARVTIVIFTNGDAYIEGVDVGFHTLFSTPAKFIQYGQARQREALAAAARVGVPASRVVFLGYPDRGLGILWGPRWDCRQPYRSPYTQRDRSPYPMSYRAGSLYCGEGVLADVKALLRREHPTAIIMHHPEDTHRDHWASEAFATFALESLALGGDAWARSVHVYHYLVHHGAWPSPREYAPDLYLRPPRDLWAGHPRWWWEYPLRKPDEDAKLAAALEYHSQIQLAWRYLLSFVRRDDLFDLFPPVRPVPVEAGALPFGAPDAWDRLPAVIHVSGPGSLMRAAEGSGIFDSIALAQGPDRLFLAVRLRRPAIREVQYRLEMRLFYADGHTGRLVARFVPPRFLSADRSRAEDLALPAGAAARSLGSRIDFVLPTAGLGDPVSLYLHLVTIGPLRRVVDQAPWSLIRLLPSSGPSGPRGGHPPGPGGGPSARPAPDHRGDGP